MSYFEEGTPSLKEAFLNFWQSLPPEGIGLHSTSQTRAAKIMLQGFHGSKQPVDLNDPNLVDEQGWLNDPESARNWNCFYFFHPETPIRHVRSTLDKIRRTICSGWTYGYGKSLEDAETGLQPVGRSSLIVIRPFRTPYIDPTELKFMRQGFELGVIGKEPQAIPRKNILGDISLFTPDFPDKLFIEGPTGKVTGRKTLNQVMLEIAQVASLA